MSVWSLADRDIVARCEGHSSWVMDVSFDPFMPEASSGRYRFGSVGQDAKLLLWDFSGRTLSAPKHVAAPATSPQAAKKVLFPFLKRQISNHTTKS